jgi:hypothetical protein
MKLFIHRKNVYAVQVKSGDEYIYVPKYEVLTENEVQRHLDGKITLGVYALNEDNTVKWLCFDIDHAHVENSEEACKVIFEKCVAQFGEEAVRIEESGTPHNFHVWVFFAEPIQAVYARSLGLLILKELNKGVEVFPKQTTLTGKRLGNLVKLPLGLHQKSGKWSKMNIEGIKPCLIDVTKIEAPTAKPFEEKPRLEGYKGREPNCITKIKKGVKEGARNNSGIIYASYLTNFKQLNLDRGYYLFRLWNGKNKPRLSDEELRAIFEQAIKAGYVFGCGHEYLREFCVKEGCVFEESNG